MQDLTTPLQSMRAYYESGATLPLDFRLQQLVRLRQMVVQHEKQISDAIYADLKKGPEEVYASETGLVISDLTLAIKNLRSWMTPVKVPSTLATQPASSTLYRDPL